MKARSARNLVLFTFLIFFFISCSWHKPVSPNAQNVIELKFRENTIRFNNVTIEEYFLDLDGGLGLRAFGESAPDNSCCSYYVVLDIKSLGNNSYKPHKINFGVNKRLAPNTFYRTVYYANFTEGYNTTNFNITMDQKSPDLEGSFYGSLRTTYSDEIAEVSKGVYHLNLKTVKKY
jgi:hypothetical protein